MPRESPRIRRLRSDFRAIQQLKAESTILDFVAEGDPPMSYLVRFYGKGLWRIEGSNEVLLREHHELTIDLGASYPRMQPELAWKTPIFHPNISASGVVCLGGYGTYWVPGVQLYDLCTMLWDMIRYQNYDTESPYNRDAAGWAKTQQQFQLPVDTRPLRDRIADVATTNPSDTPPVIGKPRPNAVPDVMFIEPEIVQAEIVEADAAEPDDADILFID